MPPEPLPIDRKDFSKDRKPSSSEPVEVLPARWKESPTTPSSQYNNNHGSPSSYRWGGAGGLSDFRRPFTGHGKSGGGWQSVESGPPACLDSGNQKDPKGGNFRETSASPSSNSHTQSDFVNHWDQLQLNDQHAKSSGDGVSTTGDQRLEKAVSLGSSLDWKPLKWIRSGSLSSRGSGFSHLSSCKIIGVDPVDTKMDAQAGAASLLQSPSGDASTCVTPNTPDEANSRKKPRLGWGEGLAKYEKKKVDPEDIVDKENGSRIGIVNSVSNSESLLLSSAGFPGKSPSITGNSESASPVTSCSIACSLSPGLEEKTSVVAATVDNDTCAPGAALPQNHTNGLSFSLENFDFAEDFNLSSSLDELLRTDDTIAPGSGFAVDKLQVWKADISKTIEVTESEIDSLEQELKSLISVEDSCPIPRASSSFFKRCSNNNTADLGNASLVDISLKKADTFLEEPRGFAVCLDMRSEKDDSFKDHVCRDGSQIALGSTSTVTVGGAVYLGRDDKSYDLILGTNKVMADRASDELSKLLPTKSMCTDIVRSASDSMIKKRISMRKRFLRFKERVITLKFRALQYSWKENLHFLSVRSGAKSHKKFESSSRLGYVDSQKHRAYHSRSTSSAGCLRLVPTKEVVEYVSKLLLDSRVKTYRNAQKMPTFILDKRERSSKFISDNGLVENPVDVEKKRAIVNSWTEEDKQLFLEKYALFGKNFRKIASFFQHKTVADCVEFYYKNHKSESFQSTKKNSKLAKGKSCDVNTNSTYLVTHGKRPNRETGATSLDMLGAASAMVANVNERSNDFAIYCNEQETVAADVLAGICGSISSEALGSCITSSVDHQKFGRSSLNDVDEETCSDESCGEDMNSSIWTDEERSSFIKALKSYGKDFSMISRCMGTRSSDQCRNFFSKVKKCFGWHVMDLGVGREGTTGANQGGGDQDDTCMVDSGSGISNDKSSMECKMDAEDLNSSDFREEQAESDRNVATDCREPEVLVEDKVGGILEGAADSEAANLEESPQNTCSDSASGAKVEEVDTVAKSAKTCTEGFKESEHELPCTVNASSCPSEDLNSVSFYSRGSSLNLTIDHANTLDLNAASENVTCHEAGNDFVMSNLFPQDSIPQRKTVSSQDDVSSRLTFRKSGQRSSSIDGYQLNLHKRSLSSNEPQSKLKLDESLLLPIDGCIQVSTDLTPVSQQQRRSSSLDLEKPSRIGDVKLFGQIITNHSLPKSNSSAQENKKPEAGKSYNLKFDQSKTKDYSNERNYGFWDGNRIQTGYSSLPGSAVLLAKYPAAFSNISTLPKLDQHQHSSLESGNEQCNNLNVVSGFQTRKLTNHSRGPSYHAYSQPFTVDKLLPEMPRRKDFEGLSTGVGGMNAVGGACNGVSDPVAAIRMHYAKTEQYTNGGAESWRSNVTDIGSR